MRVFKLFVFLLFFCLLGQDLIAQSLYFGQNKPRYKKIDFEVLESQHLELYHYFEDIKMPNDIIVNSEHWYKLHQEVFKLAFISPNPLIVYKNHPDFQETTAVGGQIGQGTGGVTEGLRNRVIMPMMYTHRQTDHVLGHELVHAFQYKTMTYGSDSSGLANIQNLPLFMVEGLAEYMSIGREDSHTAMWMRDAVESDDIPSIEDLVRKQHIYFPYRWGQAFWAYVTTTYGDDVIRPLFKETAINGIEAAFKRIFGMDIDRFSVKFKESLLETYLPLRKGKEVRPRGMVVASEETGSEMNVSPIISPNGKLIAYISSKNVLSLDIYIADAETGKIVNRISSNSFAGHVDSYSFIETAGSWSPDSREIAIVVQSKGKNKLNIINARSGRKKTYSILGVDAFTNPAWSPDGNSIVVSGLVEGNSDLFKFNLKSKEVINLTNDAFSDIQPSWSADGKYIYFVSDRSDKVATRLEKAKLSISRMAIETKRVESFDLFIGADNFNPVSDASGENVVFMSDRDGFRNLYSYNLASESIKQLTNYYTGVSGITMFSPALSLSQETGDIAYSYFYDGAYSILKARPTDLLNTVVDNSVEKKAGILAPTNWVDGRDLVQHNLGKLEILGNTSFSKLKEKKYESRFKLDYLANSGLGLSTSSFGTGVGGGVTGLFSDMLNNNQLSATVGLNGNIEDIGGQVYYINQKRPLQFGASYSHVPFQFYLGGTENKVDSLSIAGDVTEFEYGVARIFRDEISLFAYLPISKTQRFEFGGAHERYKPSAKKFTGNNYYSLDGLFQGANNIRSERVQKEDLEEYFPFEKFSANRVYFALVGDNATFGTVAPLNGYRYRIQVGQYFGKEKVSFTDVLVDARKYQYLKPLTLAGRFRFQGRLNPENLAGLNQINPIDLNYPWFMHNGFGRYRTINLTENEENNPNQGEQMALVNFEVRLPFTGPERLALIPFDRVVSDLNFFVDAGVVWSSDRNNESEVNVSKNSLGTKIKEDNIATAGFSWRINVMGFVIEPYLAFPIFKGKQESIKGLNFMIPGW